MNKSDQIYLNHIFNQNMTSLVRLPTLLCIHELKKRPGELLLAARAKWNMFDNFSVILSPFMKFKKLEYYTPATYEMK